MAHDLHPDYLSTTYALAREDVAHVGVQHHHAHLAAVLAEHGERGPAIGAIYDGTGYGLDGAVWGGELLAGGLDGFERAGHLWPVRLPGGDRAVRQPWRMACAWLVEVQGAAPSPLPGIEPRTWHAVAELARTGLAAPLTTSMGRLFDAVAALCGLRTEVSYEGQAAVELEAISDRSERGAYPLEVAGGVLDARGTIAAVALQVAAGVDASLIAARFHRTIARATAQACAEAAGARGLDTVVLAGGVLAEPPAARAHDVAARGRRPARARARAPAAQRRRHQLRPGRGGRRAERGAQPADAVTNATNSSISGRGGPTATRITCHARGGGAGSIAITPSRPESTSDVTASADRNEIPRPIRAAWRIAPLEPTVSVSPCRALAERNSSLADRVPESGSRSSQVRPPSSAGATGCPPASRIVGGAHQHELVGAKRPRVQALVVGRAPAEGDVRLVRDEPVEDLAAVADAEAETHLGMAGRERLHEPGDEGLGRRRDGGDPQHAIARGDRLAGRLTALLQKPDDVGGVRRERVARGRRAHAPAVALQQRRAHLARQRRDRRRDRRLGDDELVGGLRHRPGADHGEEAAQLGERDGHRRANHRLKPKNGYESFACLRIQDARSFPP